MEEYVTLSKVCASQHLHRWFNQLGIEGTIEIIEQCPMETVKEIYLDLLRKEGLVK